MDFGTPAFVFTIIAICMVAWVVTTAIRAKYGYPLTDDYGNTVHPVRRGDDETTKALKTENTQLRATVDKLEERLKVLERIATDRGVQTAEQIEALRELSAPPAGTGPR
jgi:cell division protein FtsB